MQIKVRVSSLFNIYDLLVHPFLRRELKELILFRVV